jgi:outer membrane murein-binding lipoprotein Lpp
VTTTDRLTVIGIGATVVLVIIGGSCSTNARIDDLRADMNARFGDMSARIGDVNARIGDLNAEVRAEHAEIRTDIRRIDDRLRVVERAVGSEQPAQ